VSSDLQGPVTKFLAAYRNGQVDVLHELLQIVTPELRRIAGRLMSRERDGHILRPTGLVNEAFLRLFNGKDVPFGNTKEFLAASVRHMRRVLTDYARANLARKRQESLESWLLFSRSTLTPEMLVDLSRALDELMQREPRAARIVEMKFYAGLSIEEIASVLDASPRTVVRDWEWARSFLERYLSGARDPLSPPLSE